MQLSKKQRQTSVSLQEPLSTHQDQRSIIKSIFRVDVYTFLDLFLANLEVSSPTSFTEYPKPLAVVQGIVLLESTSRDLLLLGVQGGFYLMLAEDHGRRSRRAKRCCRALGEESRPTDQDSVAV